MSSVFIPSNPNDRHLTEIERKKWEDDLENKKDDFPYIALTRAQFDLLKRSRKDAVLITEKNKNDISVLCDHGFVYQLVNGEKSCIIARKRGTNYIAYEKQESSKEFRVSLKDVIVAIIGAVCGFLLDRLLIRLIT